jgi:8-oxo-dGTP diphosphatase
VTEYRTAQPRIAVYILLEKDGRHAFVKRSNTGWRDGYYSLPSGKVEKGESYLRAAVREAKEEVGVTIDLEDLEHVLTTHRF